jgi:hypothetical protein
MLKDDAHYYGEYGRQFLSNSDIRTLLKDPAQFRKERPDGKPLAEGRYFHVSLLEPHKKDSIQIVDASTRNTNIYKEAVAASGKDILLLRGEAEELDTVVSAMRSNLRFYDLIYADGNRFEEPAVQQIKGMMWKGKADVVNPSEGLVIDLKTTQNIDDFYWSAKKNNYDSQAYIYQMLFGYPVLFLVAEKGTGRLGIFNSSEDFLRGGEEKVERALEVYHKFYGDNASEDINNFFISQTL